MAFVSLIAFESLNVASLSTTTNHSPFLSSMDSTTSARADIALKARESTSASLFTVGIPLSPGSNLSLCPPGSQNCIQASCSITLSRQSSTRLEVSLDTISKQSSAYQKLKTAVNVDSIEPGQAVEDEVLSLEVNSPGPHEETQVAFYKANSLEKLQDK